MPAYPQRFMQSKDGLQCHQRNANGVNGNGMIRCSMAGFIGNKFGTQKEK